SRMIVGVVNVFAYGFIILISLIAAANVFNTISTSIMLRRREFAMLKSIGMTDRSMRRMLSFECIIYGLRALLLGLPVSVGVTFLIHRIVAQELQRGFYVPWHSIMIAVGSVFLVVFATMLYARGKLKKDNPIDALKNENL
ncbi:MAG: FtsX-like permease family protein, partial [Clostridia bacterium]|nr:FtsX-like permease family protein [Clostridia bacterium]